MHIDLPNDVEIAELLDVEQPSCVTLYCPTTPRSQQARADRIAFKNQVTDAVDRLRDGDAPREHVEQIDDELTALEQDYAFWALQANSLAVFATPDRVRTFRLPNRLSAATHVGDRFFVKPLLRAVSFPQSAIILALSQNVCRVLELDVEGDVTPFGVGDLPSDLESAVGRADVGDPSQMTHLLGAEGDKVRMRQYARLVDAAVRDALRGRDLPLILAAASPLLEIYRGVSTTPELVDDSLGGNPDAISDVELATAARPILDGIRGRRLDDLRARAVAWEPQGRSLTDLGDVARAATMGAVDTLLVDIDAEGRGTVDPDTGAVTLDDRAESLTEEIVRRTLRLGGHVLAVRAEDLRSASPVVALLRYPIGLSPPPVER